MKETGIIFSTAMIQAHQKGLKTVTRRTRGLKEVNKNPEEWEFAKFNYQTGLYTFIHFPTLRHLDLKCPYGGKGDMLRVKETWRLDRWVLPNELSKDLRIFIGYKDGIVLQYNFDSWPEGFDKNHRIRNGKGEWQSPLFLRHEFSRYFLTLISDPMPERLQSITEAEAMAEGIRIKGDSFQFGNYDVDFVSAKQAYKELWDSLNGKKYPWAMNLWNFPLRFERYKP